MLVLSRKCNERVHIGDNVVITIVKIGHNSVRLGIEAPSDVRVRRHEHLEAEAAKQDAERAATAAPTGTAAVESASGG